MRHMLFRSDPEFGGIIKVYPVGQFMVVHEYSSYSEGGIKVVLYQSQAQLLCPDFYIQALQRINL